MLSIILVLILFLMAVTIGLILSLGAFRWKAATRRLLSELEDGSLPIWPSNYHENDLAELPTPVQRYFRAVLM